jgi:hypothetical protein
MKKAVSRLSQIKMMQRSRITALKQVIRELSINEYSRQDFAVQIKKLTEDLTVKEREYQESIFPSTRL